MKLDKFEQVKNMKTITVSGGNIIAEGSSWWIRPDANDSQVVCVQVESIEGRVIKMRRVSQPYDIVNIFYVDAHSTHFVQEER